MNEKEKILTHKVLPILGVFLLVLFTMFTSCFASFNFTYNDTSYSLPDLPNKYNYTDYFIAISSSGDNYYLVLFGDVDSNSKGIYILSGLYESVFLSGTDIRIFTYPVSSVSDGYTLKLDMNNSTNNRRFSFSSIIYSTYDVINRDTGNVVFQKAPQVKQTHLAQIVEQTKAGEILPQEILGILPILITILVGILAIMKAISFLKKILRNS